MDDRSSAVILIPPGVTVVGAIEPARVDDYWKAVEATLRTVFGEMDAASMVAAACERSKLATPETRQMYYHASPFQVASDLAGRTELGLGDRQLSSYREIIATFDPASYPPPP